MLEVVSPYNHKRESFFGDLKVSAWWRPKKSPQHGRAWYKMMHFFVFQFWPVELGVAVVTDITQIPSINVYCADHNKPQFAHVWVSACPSPLLIVHIVHWYPYRDILPSSKSIGNIDRFVRPPYNNRLTRERLIKLTVIHIVSTVSAIVACLRFCHVLADKLRGHRPMAKLFAFKMLVGLNIVINVSIDQSGILNRCAQSQFVCDSKALPQSLKGLPDRLQHSRRTRPITARARQHNERGRRGHRGTRNIELHHHGGLLHLLPLRIQRHTVYHRQAGGFRNWMLFPRQTLPGRFPRRPRVDLHA